ncbi:MAG: TrmJ/YjtD family RNA methyltransferase [Deltaproteobacteria bacterium]|nr:TrmJ/YjtD family RNA methyltransferase [Deltaproteobacteria bacterium]
MSGVNLKNVAVVLHQPQLSENIGTAARAAGNMGLGRLIVVEPRQMEEDIIMAAATRVGQRLAQDLAVYDNLAEALSDFNYVVGTTARTGPKRGPFSSPRALARKLIELSQDNRIAIVFGPERTGLTSAELRLCQAVVSIPTASPATSSLNLAQAVLIMGYELLMAQSDEIPTPRINLAPAHEVQAMYDHLKKALLELRFLPEENPDYWLMSFGRIFNRAGLTHEDCNLVRGLARQILYVTQHGSWPKKEKAK